MGTRRHPTFSGHRRPPRRVHHGTVCLFGRGPRYSLRPRLQPEDGEGCELVVEQAGVVVVERFATLADLLAYQQAIVCHWRAQSRLAHSVPDASGEEES